MDLRKTSIEKKLELFEKAKKLHQNGLSFRKIAKILGINRITVMRWIKGINKPSGNWDIDLSPSPHLSYFLGALLGDGSIRRKVHNYKYEIRLRVKDKDFAEEFAKCSSKILRKKVKIGKDIDKTRCGERYSISICNKRLWEFLTMHSMEEIIEIAKAYPKEFLRGLFDAEGSSSKTSISFSNTNQLLIKTVKNLLKFFGMKAKIRISIKKGQKVKIRESFYVAKKDVYVVYIYGKDNIEKFSKEIGFSIKRKLKRIKPGGHQVG